MTVTAEAIRAAGIDTQVFRLDDGPAQSTGTILDALKNVPGVTVDQEGKVSLRGSDKVAILIDGRQSSLTGFGTQRGLDSVSAANIEAIEIINNPSARFDAAGMAGIINIIYKKEQQLGWSGDVGFGLGVGQFTKQRRDLPTDLGSFSNNEKVIPSVNLNYRTPRTRTFIQGELLLQDGLPNNEFTTRFYDDGRVIESQVPENREQYVYTVRGGSDLTLNDTNTITVSGVHNLRASHRRRAGAVHPAGDGTARAVLVLAGGGGDRVHERQLRSHAQVRRAGPRAGRQPAVHAREGRRGVLPERGIADPRSAPTIRTSSPSKTRCRSASTTRGRCRPAAWSSAPSCSAAGSR